MSGATWEGSIGVAAISERTASRRRASFFMGGDSMPDGGPTILEVLSRSLAGEAGLRS